MGVNFIRLGHYQQSEIILNLCDELGILVWEEIPWCRGGVGNETYRRQTKRMLNNMIIQHYNHPSVIIWGLGNENDWPNDFPVFKQNEIRKLMSELNTIAHQLDKTRKTLFGVVISVVILLMYILPQYGRDGIVVTIQTIKKCLKRKWKKLGISYMWSGEETVTLDDMQKLLLLYVKKEKWRVMRLERLSFSTEKR